MPREKNPLFAHINDVVPVLGPVGMEHAGTCESEYVSKAPDWAEARGPAEPNEPKPSTKPTK